MPPDRPVPGLDDAKVQEALAGESKPNIVLMMMDNVGWGEIGTYGGGILRGAETPRIDSLAADGMKLLNYNVEPQCTPSLRSLWARQTHTCRVGDRALFPSALGAL